MSNVILEVDADSTTKDKFKLPDVVPLGEAGKLLGKVNASGQGDAVIKDNKLVVRQLLVD